MSSKTYVFVSVAKQSIFRWVNVQQHLVNELDSLNPHKIKSKIVITNFIENKHTIWYKTSFKHLYNNYETYIWILNKHMDNLLKKMKKLK